MGFAERERMADLEEWAEQQDKEHVRTENEASINWIKTLIEVSDNDPDAEMSWFIPALTLDYHGYMMEPFWDQLRDRDSNEEKTAYFQEYATGIIRQIQKLIDRSY
mgnify:CR=1 FL=1